MSRSTSLSRLLKTINLEAGMPLVRDALSSLDRELAVAKKEGWKLLKLIHGYGSSGMGGDLRVAVQRRLRELKDDGQIQDCIFGEDWAASDPTSWELLKAYPKLKQDADLGRHNQGVTIVIM